MNAYELRNTMDLINFDTEISREDFEKHFIKTKEKVTFTFNGWDGKSYNGESRRANVYRTSIKGYTDVRLVKVGKHLCYVDEERMVIEKSTGEVHPEAEWLVEVGRAH